MWEMKSFRECTNKSSRWAEFNFMGRLVYRKPIVRIKTLN
jgi:hypothetical protein